MDIKKYIICLIGGLLTSCSSTAQKKGYNPIKDLPKEIVVKFGIDIIPNEDLALKVAESILREHNRNVEFNDLKPFTINLIADGKVWDISISDKPNTEYRVIRRTYHLRINKNTGEVLNYWVDR